jgi:tetratricopeptide (TPR) repeat protein
MKTPPLGKDDFIPLVAQLGIVAVGMAVCPVAMAAGLGAGAIVGGIIGNAAWDFLKGATSNLTRPPLPLGEPNHDLNKALARAVAMACEEFKNELKDAKQGAHRSLAKAFLKHIGDPEEYFGFKEYQILKFLENLKQSPDGALRIGADNANLRSFLEDPSEEKIDALTRSAFPGNVPARFREWIIKNLHRRIAARFWDEVKGDDRAWRAYTAEVFAEFRGQFDMIDQTQKETKELLEKLIAREAKINERAVDPPIVRATGKGDARKTPNIPPDVRQAIEAMERTLEGELKALRLTLDSILAELGKIHKTVGEIQEGVGEVQEGVDGIEKKVGEMSPQVRAILLISGVTLLVLFIGILGMGGRNDPQVGSVESARAFLLSAAEKELVVELEEAEKEENWEQREQRRRAAEEEYKNKVELTNHLIDNSYNPPGKGGLRGGTWDKMVEVAKKHGVDAALAYLDNRRAEELAEIAAMKTEQEEARRLKLEPYLYGAYFAMNSGKSDKAEALFRDVLASDPGWPEARFQFCQFLSLIKGPRAEDRGTIAEAMRIHEEAHRIARRLVEDLPGNNDYERALSITHSKLGDLAENRGDLETAKREHGEHRKLALTLVERNPDHVDFQHDLIISCQRLGSLAVAMGDLPTARTFFEDAYKRIETLVKLDPQSPEWQRSQSVCHQFLGDVSAVQGNLKGAADRYQLAMKIAETLTKHDPENAMWRRDLSVYHAKLGDVAALLGDMKAASEHFEVAKQSIDSQMQQDPENIEGQRDLSIYHEKLGYLEEEKGDIKAGAGHRLKRLEIARDLVKRDPANANRRLDLCDTLVGLGRNAVDMMNWTDADAYFDEAASMLTEGVNLFPLAVEWQQDLSMAYLQWAPVKVEQEVGQTALVFFWRSLALQEKLVQLDPTNAFWKREKSYIHQKIGEVTLSMGSTTEPLEEFTQALDIRKQLASLSPENTLWQRDLAITYGKLGEVAKRKKDFGTTASNFEEALNIHKALVEKNGENTKWRRDLAIAYNSLGDAEMGKADFGKAEGYFKEALAIQEALVKENGENTEWQRELAGCHFWIGELHSARKEWSDAIKSLERAMEIVDALIVTDPANERWSTDESTINDALSTARKNAAGGGGN